MSYEILEKVKTVIRSRPKSLDMRYWHDKTPCRTTHCVAGWIQVLSGRDENEHHALDDALNVLNVPFSVGLELFNHYCWPDVFETMYLVAKTPEERVEATCMAIDDWLISRSKYVEINFVKRSDE